MIIKTRYIFYGQYLIFLLFPFSGLKLRLVRWAKIQINQQCRIRKMPRILPTKSILRLQVLLPLWRTLKLKNKQSSSPPFFSLQEFATLYFISNRHGHAHHLVKQPCEEKICFLWVYKKYVCIYNIIKWKMNYLSPFFCQSHFLLRKCR